MFVSTSCCCYCVKLEKNNNVNEIRKTKTHFCLFLKTNFLCVGRENAIEENFPRLKEELRKICRELMYNDGTKKLMSVIRMSNSANKRKSKSSKTNVVIGSEVLELRVNKWTSE